MVLKRDGLNSSDSANYRQEIEVSNVTPLSKVLQCIVAIIYLDINDLLPSKQSGFRKNHSLGSYILDRLLSDLYGAMDVAQISLGLLRCSAQLLTLLAIIYSFNAFLLLLGLQTNR